jgi:hypothetical protein
VYTGIQALEANDITGRRRTKYERTGKEQNE